MWTQSSGTIPASSQASRELSTASFTAVSSALRGLSNPSRWRFLAKNSLTEMSRCLAAIASAVVRRFGRFSSVFSDNSVLSINTHQTLSRGGQTIQVLTEGENGDSKFLNGNQGWRKYPLLS